MSEDRDEAADATPSALETDRELVGIVAVADNGVIGRDGDMPWHIPDDSNTSRRRRWTTPSSWVE